MGVCMNDGCSTALFYTDVFVSFLSNTYTSPSSSCPALAQAGMFTGDSSYACAYLALVS